MGKTNVVNLNLPQQALVAFLQWMGDTTVEIVKRKVTDTTLEKR